MAPQPEVTHIHNPLCTPAFSDQPPHCPPRANPLAQALEFPVEGFAAPLAGSMVALVQQGDEASSTGSGPLAAVCLVADEGLAGAPKGLVLHWWVDGLEAEDCWQCCPECVGLIGVHLCGWRC